ncbi:hypothetical protein Tco_0505222 [Tanacetum coccineum]
MIDGKLMLVDDDEKPLHKVDSDSVNSDDNSDVEVAYDETTQFMACGGANDASLYDDEEYDMYDSYGIEVFHTHACMHSKAVVARGFVHLEELKVAANYIKMPDQMLVYFDRETRREAKLVNDLSQLMMELLVNVKEKQSFIKDFERLRGNLVAYKMRVKLKSL